MAQASVANIKVLRVLPGHTAHLSFPIHGIIGELNVALGNAILIPHAVPPPGTAGQTFPPLTPNDYASFVASLSTTTGDNSRLKYNSSSIQNDPSIQPATLAALRAESTKAALDKAIGARQNIYYQKYSNQAAAFMQTQNTNATKSSYYFSLQSNLVQQTAKISSAYTAQSLTYPVQSGVSALTSTSNTSTSSNTSTTASGSSSTNGSGQITQNQTVTNGDWGYRIPYHEFMAQSSRSQIALQDQILAQWWTSQTLQYLPTIWPNELAGIDLDVKRLQVAYLNTILTSPIAGMVTGVRKNLGEYVKAGEPVIRVEDNTTVLLVGTLTYDHVISVNQAVTVTATLPATGSVTVSGTVAAVDGRASSREWGVTLRCNNWGRTLRNQFGAPILPIHFSLDHDTTTVAFPPAPPPPPPPPSPVT